MPYPFLAAQSQVTTFTTGASQTGSLSIEGAGKIGIHISTFSTASVLHLMVANTSTTANFTALWTDRASSLVGVSQWSIPSTTGTLSVVTDAPVGYRYMRLQADAEPAVPVSCTVTVFS